MFLSWLRHRRHRKILAEPFPAEWDEILAANAQFMPFLSAAEQERLRHDLRLFFHDRHWEGCGGLTLDDEIKVTISAHACLLTLAFPENSDPFHRVSSILVYPNAYKAPSNRRLSPIGVVEDGPSGRLGEAWYRGPVVLSWADARAGGQHARDGHNVVLHEFAHELDMLDGAADGIPPLDSRQRRTRWLSVFNEEFKRHVRKVEFRQPILIDPYGATNEAEFFAVVSESFFEQPRELRHYHPDLYAIFADFYRQDPAEWNFHQRNST